MDLKVGKEIQRMDKMISLIYNDMDVLHKRQIILAGEIAAITNNVEKLIREVREIRNEVKTLIVGAKEEEIDDMAMTYNQMTKTNLSDL